MVTSEERRLQMKAYYQANKERLLAYYQANKERLLARHKEYRGENREKISARKKYYYQNNQERSRAYTQAYQQANPGKMSAKTSKRKAAKLQRTPNWLTVDDYHAIRTLYETAAALTKSTGINHHVDHIIPLQGRTVSGFHCPTNLQILTATENQIKNNKFTGDE